MAGNLTVQVRNIAKVATAVASGDLSQKITVDVRGEILQIKNVINTMVDQLRSFAAEVTRVAREVGTEGKLGGQARSRGVSGTWKDLTDNVNSMAGNLTGQVRNIAEVTTAVAHGDLSKKITVDVQGEILELKNTINTMVDQLSSFASEVTRVAREVGTEGKLGGQADVKGVAGTWKDLTDSVNSMAGNLTGQVRNIAEVTTAVARRRPVEEDHRRRPGRDPRAEEHRQHDGRPAVGVRGRGHARRPRGRHRRQARRSGARPRRRRHWKDLTDNVNSMAGNLTVQVRNIVEGHDRRSRAATSRRKITVDVTRRDPASSRTPSTRWSTSCARSRRRSRASRARSAPKASSAARPYVLGVSGTWKDLTDNVNFMAGNLTSQVRGIAKVVTAVANGDLKRKLTVEAKGEIAEPSPTRSTG